MSVSPVSLAGRRGSPGASARPSSGRDAAAAFLGRMRGERVSVPLSDLRWSDAVVAGAVMALLVFLPWIALGQEPNPARVGTAAVIAAVLFVRRVWPAPVLAGTLALGVVWVSSGHGKASMGIALMVALFTAGDQCPPILSLPATLASVTVVYVTSIVADDLPWFDVESLGYLGWPVAAAGAGLALRSRRVELAAVLDSEAQRREHEAERRVIGERLRIAQELHDAVGHTVATVTMQAGVAARLIDDRPNQAREALEHIAELSRTTLQEIRSTLGMLRTGDGDAAETAPVRSLADIDGVFEVVRGRGVTVHVERRGAIESVSAGLAGMLYRIAQEAATNIVRHGEGATTTWVSVDAAGGEVALTVRNDGDLLPGPVAEPRGHHGLDGMRERAAALGGTVLVGPCPHGGFEVRAVIPVDGPPG